MAQEVFKTGRDSHGRPTRPNLEKWGGFLLHQRSRRILHVTLTGELSDLTISRIHQKIRRIQRNDGSLFIILDVTHLKHIPLTAARRLADEEQGWRNSSIITLWVGLSPYLANLLILASHSEEILPCFADLKSTLGHIRQLSHAPSGVARECLGLWGSLCH